ncbi:MAG: hypothetical protein AB1755_03455 [Candidatus Omnitrophota bacterium]
MPSCFVKEGACEKEILITVNKISKIKFKLNFQTSCPYINNLANYLGEINVGEALSQSLLETEVYRKASKFVCRNSCSVPAAILKLIEVESNTFAPKTTQIEFIKEI